MNSPRPLQGEPDTTPRPHGSRNPVVTDATRDLITLTHRLETYRVNRTDLSILQLCAAVGWYPSGYYRLKRGTKRHPPDRWRLLLFADVLKLTRKERDELFVLAGYDPAEIPRSGQILPWSPDANLSELGMDDLTYLQGRIQQEREARRRYGPPS